jgi:hypothetical protein
MRYKETNSIFTLVVDWRRIPVRTLRMQEKSPIKDFYAVDGSSLAQRVVLTAALGACVGMAWWLLFGGGIESVGAWFGWVWNPGNRARRLCLAVTLSIYFVRLLFTQFMFLRRAVSWSEAWMIGPWVLCIYAHAVAA